VQRVVGVRQSSVPKGSSLSASASPIGAGAADQRGAAHTMSAGCRRRRPCMVRQAGSRSMRKTGWFDDLDRLPSAPGQIVR